MRLKQIAQTSRNSFNDTWLNEMPSGLGSFATFDTIEYTIKDFIKHGIKPAEIGDGLNKIETSTIALYWFSRDGEILIGAELYKKPEALVVSVTGKNPKFKGKPPFASELYSAILKDAGKNVRVMSDSQLSDEGLSLWKKMISAGHTVSVYDRNEPGKTFASFVKPSELDAFFKHDDTDFLRYQYVLSENVLEYCSMRASFNLRLLRENTPGAVLID